MKKLMFPPGATLVSNFNGYQHYSVASDRVAPDGQQYLISASRRNGTVAEEPMSTVTQGRYTYVADIPQYYAGNEIVAIARSFIGNWQYNLITDNCEHFAKLVSGNPAKSTQLVGCSASAALGYGLVKLYSENPTAAKIGAGILVGGLVGLALTRAVQKQQQQPEESFAVSV